VNTYLVQYSANGGWVALSVRDTSIDAVLESRLLSNAQESAFLCWRSSQNSLPRVGTTNRPGPQISAGGDTIS
jgi:hypothetical protein